jgi:hypothetical protein
MQNICRRNCLFICFLLCGLAGDSLAADKPASVLVVSNFGAKGDGQTLDTVAIQQAIDQVHAQGGGVVEFPKGTYRSGTVEFNSGVTQYFAKDATLLSVGTPSQRNHCCTRRWKWWLGAELNRRHKDFQSSALPTELPSHSIRPNIQRIHPSLGKAIRCFPVARGAVVFVVGGLAGVGSAWPQSVRHVQSIPSCCSAHVRFRLGASPPRRPSNRVRPTHPSPGGTPPSPPSGERARVMERSD